MDVAVVEIKFRSKAQLAMMHRLDPELLAIAAEQAEHATDDTSDDAAKKRAADAMKKREQQ